MNREATSGDSSSPAENASLIEPLLTKIERCHERAARAHGLDSLACSDFVTTVIASLAMLRNRGETGDSELLVDTLVLDDLYLACACAKADECAWKRLERLYAKSLMSLALRWRKTVPDAREIARGFLADLFLPAAEGRPMLIATYNGTGRLLTWLRLVLASRLGHAARARRRDDIVLDDTPVAAPVTFCADKHAERAEEVAGLRKKLTQVLDSSSERDRLIFVMHYEDGLRQSVIARALGVSEATVSRRLDFVRERLRGGQW